jgi:hypothetical protein
VFVGLAYSSDDLFAGNAGRDECGADDIPRQAAGGEKIAFGGLVLLAACQETDDDHANERSDDDGDIECVHDYL